MSLRSIAPPPIQIPADFAVDKVKGAFFGALINTLSQLWITVFNLQSVTQIKTTDATPTGLVQIPIAPGRALMIEAHVVVRRTGGTAGAEGDAGWFVLTGAFSNVSGAIHGVSVADIIGGSDQVGLGVAFASGVDSAVVFVTGLPDTNMTWQGTFNTYEVGA